jgi:hypothetical protein
VLSSVCGQAARREEKHSQFCFGFGIGFGLPLPPARRSLAANHVTNRHQAVLF